MFPQTLHHGGQNVETYAIAVYREVVRIQGRRRQLADADDIAQTIVERFLADAAWLMSRYPDPITFARATAANGATSHDRTQRSQRGEGARLVIDADGRRRPARQVVSGSAAVGGSGPSMLEAVRSRGDPVEDEVIEQLVCNALLQRCVTGLRADDVELVYRVHGLGETVVEIARSRGRRREAISRRLSHTHRAIRANLAVMELVAGDVLT